MGPLVGALPLLGTISGLAGTAVSAFGAIQAGQAQAANAQYQAAVARNNQNQALYNSAQEAASGEAQAAAQGMKAKAAVGSLIAAQGANNVDVNTGSALDVRTGAQSLANLDTRTIMSNAAKRAYGDQVQASNFGAQATLDTQEASQASTAGGIGALGSFLSGISSTGANWLKYGGTASVSPTDAGVSTTLPYSGGGIGMM